MDLNDVPSPRGDDDLEVISAALRLIAYKWVPEIFPQGRIGDDGGSRSLRVADISGRPPKDKGSCRIWIEGEHAGDWVDFESPKTLSGKPVSTLKYHFNVDWPQACQIGRELIAKYGGNLETAKQQVLRNGHANGKAGQPEIISSRVSTTISHYLSQCVSAVGVPQVEKYWSTRKLGSLPPAAFGSIDNSGPDFAFIESATNYDTLHGHPTILCRFRQPDGMLTGAVNCIHLLDDGSWHLGKDIGKKTWGPRINGGVAMLAPINEAGELGIGEGVESTAAGMVYFPGVGAWAACGTAAMVKAGEWLAANPSYAQAIKRLLIWADAGRGGESTAHQTAALARQAGITTVELYFPRSGDDLAKDLAEGYPPPAPIIDQAPAAAPGLPFAPAAPSPPAVDASELQRRLMAVEKGADGNTILELCNAIAACQLDPISREQAVSTLYRRSGFRRSILEKQIAKAEGVYAPSASGQGRYLKPWSSKFALSNTGDPKSIMANVAIVLREAPEIVGAFAHNEFKGMIHVVRKLPWEPGAGNPCAERLMTDADELAALEWIQAYAGIHATRNVVFDAIQLISFEHKYHPVKEYLTDVHNGWDRTPRLERAAITYFGVDDTEYHREIFKRWIISGAARVLQPGCKADCMTVFEGPQGLGKSTGIRVLFDPWFTDQLAEMGTKDASIELRGIWCAEYSDLEGMTRAAARTIKSYMSRTTDHFRPPYGRFAIDAERQNVFAGTTNDQEYLKDATGARRFWPFRCTFVDRDGLIRDRDNLWGEAVAMYREQRAQWWIDEAAEPGLAEAAAKMADARYQNDVWDAVIKRWLANNGRANVTTDELMNNALEIADKSKWSRNDQVRVGMIMRRMKWIRARDTGGAREWRYWRPGTLDLAIAIPEN